MGWLSLWETSPLKQVILGISSTACSEISFSMFTEYPINKQNRSRLVKGASHKIRMRCHGTGCYYLTVMGLTFVRQGEACSRINHIATLGIRLGGEIRGSHGESRRLVGSQRNAESIQNSGEHVEFVNKCHLLGLNLLRLLLLCRCSYSLKTVWTGMSTWLQLSWPHAYVYGRVLAWASPGLGYLSCINKVKVFE